MQACRKHTIGHRSGNRARDAKAWSSARNQSIPASPVCCETNQSRIASASCSAWRDISTRKAMLTAHVAEELVGRSGASRLYVIMSLFNTTNCFFKVLALPFKVRSEGFIERIRWSLTTTACEFFQFSLAFWFERYCCLQGNLPTCHPKALSRRRQNGFCIGPHLA